VAERDPLTAIEKSWMVSVKEGVVNVLKFESPLYVAVIECGPTFRDGMESAAVPAVTAAGPSKVVPSKNVTEPVGEPTGDETFAVKTTAFETKTALAEETRETAGVALLTVNDTMELEVV
jgi:hypothetical protein